MSFQDPIILLELLSATPQADMQDQHTHEAMAIRYVLAGQLEAESLRALAHTPEAHEEMMARTQHPHGVQTMFSYD
jgi:hypothetical protein